MEEDTVDDVDDSGGTDRENGTDGENASKESEAYFSAIEARVIAVLMEKLLATPNNYPLTMNSLTLGCNQKSNREPVMNLTEGQVAHTVNLLHDRRLAKLDYGERANKVHHLVADKLNIDRNQQALMAVMMLRSPQTLNELKTRTARMADFDSIDALQDSLNDLVDRDWPLVVVIPRGPGQREDRYTHTLCGEVDVASFAVAASAPPRSPVDEARLDALEARIAAIEEQLGIRPDGGD